MASVATAAMSAISDPTIVAAIHRVSDLNSYSPAELASTREWAFVAAGSATRHVAQAGSFTRAALATTIDKLNGTDFRSSGLLEGVYVASLPLGQTAKTITAAFGDTVVWPVIERQQTPKLIPTDPRFVNQWHLRNTGQSGGTVGADANITNVWDNYTGAGVVIGVVDDGVTPGHQDLALHYNASLSYDFNRNDPIPDGGDHGTSVAGVALSPINGVGGVGAAPGATLSGLQLIDGTSTDIMEANALAYKMQEIDIYTNSWGPFDSGAVLEAPGPLTLAAIRNVALNGRGGLGGIYTWANGNGYDDDNSNFDGYANSRYTIGVGAITNYATRSPYSEPGANMLISAYSNGGSLGINTTAGSSNSAYTTSFGGTSSATPLAAGVIALMLEANPNLTWRDVQHILVQTAEKVSPTNSGWAVNGAGHDVNHLFGFGGIDANAAVGMAQTWSTVGEELVVNSGVLPVNAAIPNNSTTGISRTFEVTDPIKLETVEIVFTAAHTNRGELQVILTSPMGTQSILSGERANDTGDNFNNWVFSTVRNWDEDARGTWTLKVIDNSGTTSGTWTNWQMNLYGTSLGAPVPTIRGIVYDDTNANGLRNDGENGVSGAWVYLDLNNNSTRDAAEPSAQTNLSGSYTITDLAPGNYSVRVDSLSGRRLTSSASLGVTLADGQTITGRDFALTSAVVVGGKVFDDANNNGIRDGSELGIAGARVYLDANNNQTFDNTVVTLSSTNVPLLVPPSGTSGITTSTLVVPGGTGTISKLTIKLSITHTYTGDLMLSLIAPDGTRVLLADGAGGSGDNFINTVFDDAAASSITSGSAPFTGTYVPASPLAALIGKNYGGTWSLEVNDEASGDSGTLTGWSITVNDIEASLLTNASGDYSFLLGAGTHNIRQAPLASPFAATSPSTLGYAINASPADLLVRDFGNRDTNRPLQTGAAFNVDTATQSVTIGFSEDVVIDPSKLTLTNLTTSTTIASSNLAVTFNSTTHTATVTFPGFANGILPNADWRLSVSSLVADGGGALIGNPSSVDFYTLAGDMNRDRVVNFDDLLVLAQNYGQSGKVFSQGNLNYSADGAVDFDDLLILAQNYGQLLVVSTKASSATANKSRARAAGQVFAD